MAFINTQQVLLAVEEAALEEANHVLPQLIEGSQPAVAATVEAVFDILLAGIDAGLAKVPLIGGILRKIVNGLILTIESSIQDYIKEEALRLQTIKI